MSGGGARSAYQAGVISGLHQIATDENLGNQLNFQIFSGISGGAINATFLASHAEDWSEAVKKLWDSWSTLTLESVMSLDTWPIFKRAAKLASQLGLGGLFEAKGATELLNAEPLRKLLLERANFEKLNQNLRSGVVHALGLTATHYGTGTSVTFYQSQNSIKPWVRSTRVGKPTELNIEHVLASSAIPFLFPPVFINNGFYGDGAMRMSAPLSPAIHLGADRILAIGVRYLRSDNEVISLAEEHKMTSIHLADIAGAALNALFLDAVDSDIERLERINRTLELVPKNFKHPESLRTIPALIIRPSMDLGAMAQGQLSKFSWPLRHLLKGLGTSGERGSDLISYLAFDSSYTNQLLELGRQDAMNQKAQVLNWLQSKLET